MYSTSATSAFIRSNTGISLPHLASCECSSYRTFQEEKAPEQTLSVLRKCYISTRFVLSGGMDVVPGG